VDAHVALNAVRGIAPEDIGGDAVEDEVADRVGPIEHVGCAVEERDLVIHVGAKPVT
jgi:hypothetical protein